MKKIIPLIALLLSSTAMAKSEPIIVASNQYGITIFTKTTRLPVNVLFGKTVCYKGTPEDVEQIIQKSIKNRGDFALTDLRILELARQRTVLIAEIDTGIDVKRIDLLPCDQ